MYLKLTNLFLLVTSRFSNSVVSNSANNTRLLYTYLNSKKMSEKRIFERLPSNILPTNYSLYFKPDLTNFTFEGRADITVNVKTQSKKCVLNSVELQISNVTYKNNNQSFDSGINIVYSKENETATFEFPQDIQIGEGTLSINFTGELNDKLKGFYRSKYTSASGETRYAAVTQFEPTDARQAFPCWDEPAIKATFDIVMAAPKDRVVLSNMPVDEESACSKDEKIKIVKFKRSPIMSTYLLALVVGEYDFLEATDSNGVLVRVYTPVGKKEQGKFALDVAVKTLPFYNNYFNVAYPLPKMDLIAIADFAAGAMENWGLVTYRENALLIDEANSSNASKQRVALVVGHEIAHQWFGNLVTMEWWTHLWLNEGFASWIEYLCVDHCFPEFDIWTQFASTDFSEALNLDALKSSHPIEVPVGHPSEIDEIFDSISYCKGASVIRMLHDYIGDQDYRKGMNVYLKAHAYKNTFTEDLWQALGNASGKPIEKIMSTWTLQMGYPIIKVKQRMEGNKRILTLHQERFIADGSKDETNSLWMIPISICSASSPTKSISTQMMSDREAVFTIDNVPEKDWIKLNVGGVGVYRTCYPSEMLDMLIPAIKDQSLPPRDRLALVNDLFAMTRAGEVSPVDLLRVVEAYSSETNYTVWSDLNLNLAHLSMLYQHTDFHDHFKAFLKKLFTPIYKQISWDSKKDEGPLTSMLRSIVIGRLGRSGDQAIVDEAFRRFNSHLNNSNKIPGDLRSAVYGIVARFGNTDHFDKLIQMYKESDLQEEKMRILRSIGSVVDPNLVKRCLQFAISDDVRSSDTVFGIASCTGTVETRLTTWNFVKEQWDNLYSRYQGGFLLSRLVKSTTEDFVSEEMAKEVDEFFKAHPAPSAQRNIQQSLESIRLNMKQLKTSQSEVKAFLQAYA